MDKIGKLKSLLDINDEFINIRGLIFDTEDFDDGLDDEEIIKLDKLFFDNSEERKIIKPTNLKVEAVIKEEDDYIKINDNLGKIPFSWINCGVRGAGKTTLTFSLIDKLDSYFHNIIVFSPTIDLDMKWKMLFEKLDREFEFGINVFTKYSEDVLRKILNKIKKKNKNKPFKDKVRTLIVYDDIVCGLPKQQRKTVFNKLLLNNRHYNVSIIVNSQKFSLFDTALRVNCSQICLWKTWNYIELKKYIDEFSAVLGQNGKEQRENFLKLYYYATSDPHSFFFINTHNPTQLFYKNLDEPIDIPSIVSQPLENFLPDLLKKKKGKVGPCGKYSPDCKCFDKNGDLIIKDKDDK